MWHQFLTTFQSVAMSQISSQENKLLADLYKISHEAQRMAFLDDLTDFMQKRGTPINRLPVMAGQPIDLFELYNMVCAKGGVLQVIIKKMWQDVIKALNLPYPVTSATFYLRNKYIKILYPYECMRRGFSRPEELDALVSSNKRSPIVDFDQYETTSTDKVFWNSMSNRFSQPLPSNARGFEQIQQCPQTSVFEPLSLSITQQNLLKRCMKMAEEQRQQQQEESSDVIPMVSSIKREREDNEDDESRDSKKFIPDNLLTPPTSISSEEEYGSSLVQGKPADEPLACGMQFSLKRDGNGQLCINLEMDGIRYEGALKVVS